MERDFRKEIGDAIKAIACNPDEAKGLTVEELSKRVIQQIKMAQIPDGQGLQGKCGEFNTETVDTPEFWKFAGKSYLAELLSELLDHGQVSFLPHLTCYGRRWT
jgi:hypothetical protein